jgi:hypothetical protein
MFSKRLVGRLAVLSALAGATCVVPAQAAMADQLQEATQMASRPYPPRASLTTPFALAHGRSPYQRVQYRGEVTVGSDGNGVTAARFPTTIDGHDVRYVLVVDNGCSPTVPAARRTTACPAAVANLQVSLNEAVVFQTGALQEARHDIALNAVDGTSNTVVFAASGTPGAAARMRILAVRTTGPWRMSSMNTSFLALQDSYAQAAASNLTIEPVVEPNDHEQRPRTLTRAARSSRPDTT